MADGSVKIVIEVDGKQVNVASKELDKLEEAGLKSGKGIKAAEGSMDSLSDSSAKAGSNIKGAKDSIDDLGDSSSKAGKDLKSTDDAMGGLSDSSINASSSIKGTKDSIDSLGDSGSKAGKDLKGVDSAINGLSDSSSNASSSIKGTSDSLDNLSDSGSKAAKNLNGVNGAIDGTSDSSASASSSVKGTDSAIDSLSDSSANASSGVKGVSDSLGDMSRSANDAAKGVKNVKDETDGIEEKTQKASIGLENLSISSGLVKIASVAFDTLKKSMDDAISRFDTLNAFPKILQSLGVSTEEADQAMQKLSDGIDGLPTTLDDIAGSAQEMYTSFNDMDKATDTAVALNNALLGSGASAEQAKRGTQQYSKALQTGKVDMMMWNTLSETMDVGLIKIAEGFGYAGKSAKNDLYKALQNGTITLDEFNDKLIEVGTGTGVMAELAKENSLGIATSLTNLKNAAAKGIANIIDSFNKLSKEVTGKEISENIDSMKVVVNASFSAIQKIIEATTPVFKMFGVVVKGTISVVKALSPAIVGLMTAYAAYTVITKANEAIQASNTALKIAMASKNGLTLATKAKVAAEAKEIAVTEVLNAATAKGEILTKAQVAARANELIATKAQTIATAAQTGAVKLSTVATGLMTGAINLSTVALTAKTAATTAWGTAMEALTGPIGWVVIGLGALVTATIAVVKWFKRGTEEGKRLKEETDALGDSTDTLSDSISSSSDTYKQNQRELEATTEANRGLIDRIEELSEKENKSAEDKLLLTGYINKLNESIDGLNLSYNEESDALSQSSDKLRERVDLIEEETSYNDALARQSEITQEQIEIEMQLDEVNEKRAENLRLKDEGSITNKEYKDTIEALDEQEQKLTETEERLKEENKAVTEQVEAGAKAVAEATSESVESQMIDFENLEGAQKEAFDNMSSTYEELADNATNAFDRMEDKSELTGQQMIDNLEHNQAVTEQWGENMAKLYDWAGKNSHEGLIKWLDTLGPDSAAELAIVADMGTGELERFAELMDQGGEVAGNSLKTSLGNEYDAVIDEMIAFVDNSALTMRSQIEVADFASIGGAVPEGLAKGIEDGSKNAETASKNVAKATEKAARDESETHSPSRVFKRIGTDITDGLALGINDGTNKVMQAIQKMFKSMQVDSANSFKTITKDYDNTVKNIEKTLEKLPKITQKIMKNMLERLKSGASKQIQAMRKLSKDLVSPFNSLQSKFNSIGRNAMSGLNAGLNSGRGRVMSTARSIANSVASTMQNALKIHSPSKVMKYDVGRWIPEGLAEGIKGNAPVVYNALNKMSGNMMRFSTPEMALGVSGMRANASTISQFSSNSTTKTINNNNKPTIHIEKIENYSDTDVPRVLEESAWIMDRERRRLDD